MSRRIVPGVWLLAALLIGACGGKHASDAGVDARRDAAADRRADSARDAATPADGGDSLDSGAPAEVGPGCSLPPVGASLNRDFDVHLATVSGTITLAGAALPDSPGLTLRGNLVLRERASGDVRTIPVGAAGAATFSAILLAGSYDVAFETAPNPALVGLPPASRTRLASAVAIAGTARLDYDLRLVAVTGAVTLGGATLPDSPGLTSRGNVVFRERLSGDVRTLPVGAIGAGSFTGSLFPGTYDVSFETVTGSALMGLPSSAETRVATGVTLAGDTPAPPPLSYDVQVAPLAGTITAGGAALPESPTLTTRGSLMLRETRSGDVRTFAVPATGAASYAGLLFTGTYDVTFQTPSGAGLVGLPAGSATRLASSVAIAAGTASAGYDLSIANVTGTITTGGAPLPDSPNLTTRGNVRFVERTTGLASNLAVAATGAATFAGALFAGSYDVALVDSGTADLVGLPPGGSKRVATAVALGGAAATLSYDVPVVTVTGTISSGGLPLPSSPALPSRGNVVFRDRETGAAVSLPVGASGPGTFTGRLFTASYDVTFETVNSPELLGLPAGAETRLASNLAVTEATAAAPLTWDAPVITLSGQVTLDGAPLPDSPGLATRGNLVFRDKLSGDARTLALPPTGPATFSASAFAGSYDVSFETAASPNLVGLPAAAETNIDVGCLPASTCAADPADLTGNWTFIFRDQVSWIRWSVSLTQTGAALGGRFAAATGYSGQFDTGTRSGDTIQLSSMQNTSTCVLRVDATLSTGCFMTGTGACASGTSGSPFVGVR